MSDQTAVNALLARLFKCSGTISSTYYNTRIAKNEENASDIGLLRQVRLLSPDIRDTFQLRSSFRQFLNTDLICPYQRMRIGQHQPGFIFKNWKVLNAFQCNRICSYQ